MDGPRQRGEQVFRRTERGTFVKTVVVTAVYCGLETWVYTVQDAAGGEVWTTRHVYDAPFAPKITEFETLGPDMRDAIYALAARLNQAARNPLPQDRLEVDVPVLWALVSLMLFGPDINLRAQQAAREAVEHEHGQGWGSQP